MVGMVGMVWVCPAVVGGGVIGLICLIGMIFFKRGVGTGIEREWLEAVYSQFLFFATGSEISTFWRSWVLVFWVSWGIVALVLALVFSVVVLERRLFLGDEGRRVTGSLCGCGVRWSRLMAMVNRAFSSAERERRIEGSMIVEARYYEGLWGVSDVEALKEVRWYCYL